MQWGKNVKTYRVTTRIEKAKIEVDSELIYCVTIRVAADRVRVFFFGSSGYLLRSFISYCLSEKQPFQLIFSPARFPNSYYLKFNTKSFSYNSTLYPTFIILAQAERFNHTFLSS